MAVIRMLEVFKYVENLVGSWIDQNRDETVQIDCNWAKNQNFLRRSFAVAVADQAEAGMQIIRWDPIDNETRS